MDKAEKIKEFAKRLGVTTRMAYNYLNGRGMPIKRASYADTTLGGGVMLWAEDGSKYKKVELYNRWAA